MGVGKNWEEGDTSGFRKNISPRILKSYSDFREEGSTKEELSKFGEGEKSLGLRLAHKNTINNKQNRLLDLSL